MKLLLILVMLFCSQVTFAASQEEKLEILKYRVNIQNAFIKHTDVINAVIEQNALNRSIAEIKTIDKAWRAGTSPLIESLQVNAAANRLSKLIKYQGDKFSEVFLTDNQGANIAAYPPTSDYWQGDEAKFTKSFNDGDGTVFFGEPEFDKSTNKNAIQISRPVLHQGKTIGVLVVGVIINDEEMEKLK